MNVGGRVEFHRLGAPSATERVKRALQSDPAKQSEPQSKAPVPFTAEDTSKLVARAAMHARDASTQQLAADELEITWRKLWEVSIGSTFKWGQIAARGPLIAVASRGVANENDDKDGVHIIDGRDLPELGRAHRTTRILKSPLLTNAAKGAGDAIGVALDGDFVVFGTFGGLVTKVRLDGRQEWLAKTPEGTRPVVPALMDVNNDQTLDVIVPLMPLSKCESEKLTDCGPGWEYSAIGFDGRTGRQLWTIGTSNEQSFKPPQSAKRYAIDETPADECSERAVTRSTSAPIPTIVIGFACSGEQFVETAARLTGSAATPIDAVRGRNVGKLEAQGLADDDAYNLLFAEHTLALQRVRPNEDGTVPTSLTVMRFKTAIAAPTIADINQDGTWDVLVAADDKLGAFSARGGGDAARTLPRGDLAATGLSAWIDTPEAYASRIGGRDRSRWLHPDRLTPEGSWKSVGTTPTRSLTGNDVAAVLVTAAGGHASELLLDVSEASESTTPTVIGPVHCDRDYGVNEGRLLVREAGEWHVLSGAPSPILGVTCVQGELLVATPNAQVFRLTRPVLWWPWTLAALLVTLMSVLTVRAYSRQRLSTTNPLDDKTVARPVILSDAPRTRLADAHPTQQQLVNGLLNVIDNNDTKPPVTIALYGAWGSGKSSVMSILRSELKTTGRYIDVWFNAWRFNREEQLAPALLQTIVDEVRRQTDAMARISLNWERLRNASLRSILMFTLGSALVLFIAAVSFRLFSRATFTTGVVGALSTGAVVLSATWTRLVSPLAKVFSLEPAKLLASQDSTRRIQFVREFAQQYEQVSRHLQADTRLIVYVDDLDRCRPERVLDVLETLSMLADTGCGFFVLAIDPATVVRAIEFSYKDMLELMRGEDPEEARLYSRRYLEKMITLGVRVPAVPPTSTNTDRRLEPPEEPRRMQWLMQQLLPSASWLIASALVLPLVLGIAVLANQAGGLLNLIDAAGNLIVESKDTKPATAAITRAPAAAATTQTPALQPSAAAAPNVRKPGVSRARDEAVETLVRAPIETPPPAPAEIDTAAATNPQDIQRFSDLMRWLSVGMIVLVLLAALSLIFREALRRRRIRRARPIGKDDDDFAAALATGKVDLPSNPRNVVRFTNLARFLYGVIVESAGASTSTTTWREHFFPMLKARWLSRPEPQLNEWLRTQLDLWVESDDARRSSHPVLSRNSAQRCSRDCQHLAHGRPSQTELVQVFRNAMIG